MNRDVLFTLLGNPYEGDAMSTALSLVDHLLEQGSSVGVWACGNATLLSVRGLGSVKPRNVFAGDADYPTTAAIVEALVSSYPTRIGWSVCHFCSQERGAVDQISAVRVRPAMAYRRAVAGAVRTITVGRL